MNPEITIDLRLLPVERRHEAVKQAFAGLRPDAEILVVSDRDPRTLREALERDHPHEFTWAILTRGVPRWRVLITKSAARGVKDLPDSTTMTAIL
ncbi:MAG TPA: DUF2249 domain-containing protein [Stellaceae bacterium]|nr:DUF2249 domain-containing protein [Stellaceae bacterium]